MRTYQKKLDKDVRTTTMRFDSALYARMQALAEERGVSLSALVHEAVRRDLDAPAAGGGYLTQIDRLVGSGRDPVVTVTATLGEARAYHGRIDAARWAEFRGYGKLPLLLTFEYAEDEHHRSDTSPAEMAMGHVSGLVEDPGASYFREVVRVDRWGNAAARDMNDPALSRLRLQRALTYQNEVIQDLDAATSVRDLYARLQARVDSGRFEKEFMGPRLYPCKRAVYEMIQKIQSFVQAQEGSLVHQAFQEECAGVVPAASSNAIYWLVGAGEFPTPESPDVMMYWYKVVGVITKFRGWPTDAVRY